MSETIYLHPNIRVYRKEIFEKLASECNVDFAFTGVPKFESHISNEISQLQSEFQGDFVQCKEFNISIRNLSWFIFSLPFRRKYKNVIFSCCLSFPFLLMAIPLKIVGKRIYIFDELWRYPQEVKKFGCLSFFVKFLIKYFVDGVVTAGSKAQSFYREYFDLPENKIHVAFNTTVNPPKNDQVVKVRIKERIDSFCQNKSPKILYLGRIVEYKGLDILIKSLAKINSDFNLFVVGDGDFREEAECLVLQLGLSEKVFFLGACLSNESAYYYEATDGFILPTKFLLSEPVQIESWGFTINEAMAMGKPVLSTTAVGSAYDLIIDNKTGYVAKAGCVTDLATKLTQFIYGLENNTFNSDDITNHLHNTCNYESNMAAYKSMLIK